MKSGGPTAMAKGKRMTIQEFSELRFGMIVHYGLYSRLERGEWVMNRESISQRDYARLADQFAPDQFDAAALCDLALSAGMKYLVFITMHHDGFRLYETGLSAFNSVQACGRDLTAEIVAAARERGLKIGLYHSLNNWMDTPDGCDALENPHQYERFIAATQARLEELVARFTPIDVLWYDGWWPFDAKGWRSEEMNARMSAIQPDLLFNGRNGLPGDFATPEGHLTAPKPYRPWEACLTLNGSWGYHAGDHDWKSPWQVVEALSTCANGGGNLLLNVGPRGDGSVPEPTVAVLKAVGRWLKTYGEAIFGTDRLGIEPGFASAGPGDAVRQSDWTHHGPLTAKGHNLYWLVRRWPGPEFALSGLETRVNRVVLMGETEREVDFTTQGRRLQLQDLPQETPDGLCPVLRFECDGPPSLYNCGGLRVPSVRHPRYDPVASDLLW